MKEFIVYEYCKNLTKVIMMGVESYSFGEELDLFCAYTGEENHYIIIGEL